MRDEYDKYGLKRQKKNYESDKNVNLLSNNPGIRNLISNVSKTAKFKHKKNLRTKIHETLNWWLS